MAVEHAPAGRRGRAGTWPQFGVPHGFLLASGMTALMTGVISPGEAYLRWGWRVPFLVSLPIVPRFKRRRRRLRVPPRRAAPRCSRRRKPSANSRAPGKRCTRCASQSRRSNGKS
ncbi:hypothetical protein [Actinocrispum wychmicini]|uniref:hypothetical protein n=1 Tax=Actinocrispum wychmicini TaxID=1213861 RepID=UPI001FB655F9|nr:hypothetical protein [Actinocrispum wychmicini]